MTLDKLQEVLTKIRKAASVLQSANAELQDDPPEWLADDDVQEDYQTAIDNLDMARSDVDEAIDNLEAFIPDDEDDDE